MHAAKGAEADLVIIVPDCTTIVRRNILTPAEVRLAYVAMTRAKKQCVVLTPRSDCFITHFFGG
jgi:superfamily I DNA/RNA helicase